MLQLAARDPLTESLLLTDGLRDHTIHDIDHLVLGSHGRTGLSRTHEGLGQRDTPSLHAFGIQIAFLDSIGQAEIEARSRELATMFVEELSAIDGVHMWTPAQPDRRGAVVTFRPAELDPRTVLQALEADGIVAAARGGSDRPGIRFSPHFYNMESDVERAVAAIRRYVRTGL